MKITKSIITLFILSTLFIQFTISKTHKKLKSKKLKHKKSRETPKGNDLKNHYGAPSVGSPYGAHDDLYAQLVEFNKESFMPMLYHGVEKIRALTKFHPYPGYENKLVPPPIKAGEMTNVAPSANRIISPEIAGIIYFLTKIRP